MGVRIRERKGKWWVFVNHRGKRKAKCVGAREGAERVAERVQKMLATGTVQITPTNHDTTVPLFKDYAKSWLRQHRHVAGIRENTATWYQNILDWYLLPTFGEKPLNAITRASVRELVARLREGGSIMRPGKGLKPSSVGRMIAPLRILMESAVEDGYIQINPAARMGKWNRRPDAADTCDPFDREELEAITITAREHVPILWPLVGLWTLTGMRAGEVFGLQWRDIDLDAGAVIVRRTFSRGRLGMPKTRGSHRVVNILHPLLADPWAVLQDLRALRSVRETEAAVAGRGLDAGAFVFRRPDGRPWTSIGGPWRRCLALASVRYRNPEQLRHTFASTLLSRGEALLYVQEQGGWANASTVLTFYSRWIPRQAPRLQLDPK